MFGLGELSTGEGGQYSGLGGAGIALQSYNFLNTANPASLTAIDVLIQCDGIAYTTDRCHEHGSIPAWSDAATDAQVVQVTYQRVIARPGLCIYLTFPT